jgi:hypothetical protein
MNSLTRLDGGRRCSPPLFLEIYAAFLLHVQEDYPETRLGL